MDQRQRGEDQHEDSKSIGKARSRFGQILEFGQTIPPAKSIQTNDRKEPESRHQIEKIGGQNRNQIATRKFRRTKIFLGQNAMIPNEKTVTEITRARLKENVDQINQIGQRIERQPNEAKLSIDVAKSVTRRNEQKIVNNCQGDDAEPKMIQRLLRIDDETRSKQRRKVFFVGRGSRRGFTVDNPRFESAEPRSVESLVRRCDAISVSIVSSCHAEVAIPLFLLLTPLCCSRDKVKRISRHRIRREENCYYGIRPLSLPLPLLFPDG